MKMKTLTEKETKDLMQSEAYQNSNHTEHKKTIKIVKQAWQNLYPEDDRNEHPEKYYVWYSMSDDRTRASHAKRHEQVFRWDNPPEGGHPGEDYNCRCLAIPYSPILNNDKQHAMLKAQIDDIQAKIDWNNGVISSSIKAISDIENRLSDLNWKVAKTAAQGALDGVIGAWEGTENISSVADALSDRPELFKRATKLLQFAKKIKKANIAVFAGGGLSGFIGAGVSEYNYTGNERDNLKSLKNELNILVKDLQLETTKLQKQLNHFKNQL